MFMLLYSSLLQKNLNLLNELNCNVPTSNNKVLRTAQMRDPLSYRYGRP
jgi:hypothetical protein